MHLVYFTFVTQETTAVSEALQLLASLDETLVGSVMLVHVFAPFALSVECESTAFLVFADHLCFVVARRLFDTLVWVILPQRFIVLILRRDVFRRLSCMDVRA
jgi:hypothetical protein